GFHVTGVQTCALPISGESASRLRAETGRSGVAGLVVEALEEVGGDLGAVGLQVGEVHQPRPVVGALLAPRGQLALAHGAVLALRSAERRVGKEGRGRW